MCEYDELSWWNDLDWCYRFGIRIGLACYYWEKENYHE